VKRNLSGPEEIRVFDDLDRELNEVLVRLFSAMFKVKRNIVILDREQWADMVECVKDEKEREVVYYDLDDVMGYSDKEKFAIYLNPRLLKRSYQALVTTIIHEVLHIAFPKDSEEKIAWKERKLIGRFDHTPNYRLGYD